MENTVFQKHPIEMNQRASKALRLLYVPEQCTGISNPTHVSPGTIEEDNIEISTKWSGLDPLFGLLIQRYRRIYRDLATCTANPGESWRKSR